MDILIGTRNEYKATEMEYFLKGIPNVNIYFLKDMDIHIEIEEDQDTLKGNAEKKAKEISKFTEMYVLTSDGGVDIPKLGEKWDVMKNQRTVGEKKSDLEKVQILLSLMSGLKGEDRKVSYTLAIAIAKNGKLLWSGEDITEVGYISEELIDIDIPQYRWMGHIWYYPKHGKVFNKLNEEELADVRKQSNGLSTMLHEAIGEVLNK